MQTSTFVTNANVEKAVERVLGKLPPIHPCNAMKKSLKALAYKKRKFKISKVNSLSILFIVLV